jgi:hypothetical protein
MSQQINLLNPALIKQRDFLNPNNIVITLGLLSVLMLGYYGYAQKQLSLLTLQRSQAAETLSATQAQLQQTTLLHTPHEMNKALIEQIAQLEQKENMQQQILQTVNLSSATPEKGYAALMRAFAKQSLDGLWLTSFSFDSNTEKLNINGRTLQADLVPEYISNLGNEPALKGKLFSALSMNLPKVDASKNTALQTNIHAASSPASTEPEKTAAPKYIEFALQSVEEKSLTSIEPAQEEKKS